MAGGYRAAMTDNGWTVTTKARVLVAEDDRAVRDSIERALAFEGYEVRTVSDGAEALDDVTSATPDAIVLDVMMPQVDGLDVCRQLRARGDRTPILILTAKHKVADRVSGLDAGADDYLVKPFALEELLARLRALLRRTADGNGQGELQIGDLRLNPATREVWRGEHAVDLTKTEFQL